MPTRKKNFGFFWDLMSYFSSVFGPLFMIFHEFSKALGKTKRKSSIDFRFVQPKFFGSLSVYPNPKLVCTNESYNIMLSGGR